ncbi:leucine-rich repeat-containing protein 45-like [Pollicipes pollicipes]|uniref:leucine-rich repeat-containing protein 45-like n=1 Tax=Pollicipes pollicipes TaxID=41117 RepID=UPI001884DBE1|nr:leucine-rich repeat-containing protein 45-like [Pollicipes pollicipes]
MPSKGPRLGFKDGRRLDLSGSDVPTEQAAVLGNLLSTTADVTQLCLNDCLLSEDALKALCLGLCLNTSVELLELRGNNVRGPGTEHLATLLKKNGRLRALTLEWNNLGLSPPSFRVFADALRTNRGLTSLDLRSNQLDHQCAAYVARAVASNRHLSHLDLRWNGVGVLGGWPQPALRVRNNQSYWSRRRHQATERIPS